MFHGEFLPPTPAGGLPFRMHSEAMADFLPTTDAPVQATYQGEAGLNRFETSFVRRTGPGLWQLALPKAIFTADRRNAARIPVDGEPAFGLELNAPNLHATRFALRDLSTSGACIRMRVNEPALHADRIYNGVLHVPLIERIPVRIHILRIHDETEAGDRFCGARFLDMPLEARNDLALGLTRWEFLSRDENAPSN